MNDLQLEICYNTTGLSGAELRQREMRNGSQNRIILDFFKAHPNMLFTPFEVQRYTGLIRTPITSVRRSITTLADLGHLVKTNTMREGEYGELNHTWRLK
jgi:hypothetical protein